MSRSCPQCQKALRRDESVSTVQTAEGMQGVCPRCKAQALGEPEPEPRRYPPGKRVPVERGTVDAPMRVCGLCRLALYWDDEPRAIRVPENDLGVEPGAYHACRDCINHWKPAIAARLKEEHGLNIPIETLAGNSLL